MTAAIFAKTGRPTAPYNVRQGGRMSTSTALHVSRVRAPKDLARAYGMAPT